MRLSDVSFDAPTRVLRQFAALWLTIFGALSAARFYTGSHLSAVVLLIVAMAVGVTGLARPRLIRHVFGAAMVLAFPLGWVISNALLALIYYGLFTPIALVFRLGGRDALRRRTAPTGESHWEPRPQAISTDRYYQQF